MREGWRKTTLGEIYDEEGGSVQTGPFGSQLHESDYTSEGIPVIMPKDIKQGQVDLTSIARIPEGIFAKLKRHEVKEKDIIYPRRGDITKRAYITSATPLFCGTGCLRLRGTGQILSPKFLFYYLGATGISAWIENQAIGATMPNLNTQIVRNLPVKLPPLPLQTRIANLLSAYDELIEVNNRRIALLEQTAEQLYKEWFVRLRFPGYAQTAVRKGVPEGWEPGKLSQICHINQRSLRKHKAPAIIKYIDISSVSTNHISNVEEIKFSDAPSRARRIVKHNDVIWSSVRPSRRSFAKIVAPPSNLVVSTGFTVLSPNEPYENYIYLYSSHKSFAKYLSAVAKGSAYPAVSADDFENADMLIPPIGLIQRFNSIVDPMIKKTNLLQTQNQTLRRTRDLLLPRLISGQLSVQAAEAVLNP